MTGHPDRPPVRAAAPVGDAAAGLYGAVGALMLLLGKARGLAHDGTRVSDVALYESVFMMKESLVPDYDAYGVVRERTAGNLPGVVPSGVYPTAVVVEAPSAAVPSSSTPWSGTSTTRRQRRPRRPR